MLALARVVNEIKLIRDRVEANVLVASGNGVLLQTRLQTLFGMKFSNKLEQSVHEIIVNHSLAAERIGPGGFDQCIEMLLEKLNDPFCVAPLVRSEFNSSDILGSGVAAPVKTDIDWVIAKHLPSNHAMTRAIVSAALGLAGFAGRIMVEKTLARPSVELVRGFAFDQSPAWPLSVRLERPRVLCLDGFVESVSELHRLLEDAAEAKEPVLVFLRGMSDDVKNTLRVNYDRGSLRVVPVIVKFDLQGINAINDVAIATGARLVSSNMGDLISNTRLCDASRIDEAIVYPTKVVVTNTRCRREVETHVAFLRQKRSDEKVEDVAALIDLRIKSLSPNHVVVRLPDDKNYVTTSQSIDYVLRAIKSLVDHGSVTIDGKKTLATTAAASRFHATRCHETLLSIGAIIKDS